jgi:NAD(P) transhydrogenase subunit beta
MGALGFEVMLGALTTTGSLLAFAKLQGLVRGTPMTYKGQNVFNMALLAVTVGIFVYLIVVPGSMPLFFTMAGLAFVFGLLLVMPIGSADMPVVMSLLNSYAGLASAATGFVLSNKVLIIAGTLDGFSGFILSILMCRAMNRSMTNVLFRKRCDCRSRRRAGRFDARSRFGRHRHTTRLCQQSRVRAWLRARDRAGAACGA